MLWATLAGLVFGTLGLGSPLDNLLRDIRNSTHVHPASREIVLVAVDNRSIDELKVFPWPREYYGNLINKIDGYRAKRIFVDFVFDYRSSAKSDKAFYNAVKRSGKKVYLPITFTIDPLTGNRKNNFPLPELRNSTNLVHASFRYDGFGAVRRLPFDLPFGNNSYPSFSSVLANVNRATADFPIDLSIDPSSIPVVSAVDVIKGRISAEQLAGKDVVIGPTYQPLSIVHLTPGHGALPSVYLHLLGAETLKQGVPLELPWGLGFVLAFALVSACAVVSRRSISIGTISAGTMFFLIAPFVLERHRVFVDILPPLFLLAFVAIGFSWASLRQAYRARGTTNAVSGLPNLTALSERKEDCDRPLVLVRVYNFAAVAATLPSGKEKLLVEQIARRLAVGASEAKLYQGDEGIFAWFSETGDAALTGVHLDALYTMFRNPVVVERQPFDLAVTFGFDMDYERSINNRIASALVAAEQAQKGGLKWKAHDPAQLEDSVWKLSLLSQLDAAIDAGDLWVAYQPKVDIRTGKIVGAEALARWTHPEKGAISPMEFILAAEENNRIEKLTLYVLESAVRVAATINRHGEAFDMSVNLSARLIDDPTLVRTTRRLLTKHDLDPERLTLEVTETAALGDAARSLSILRQLRDMGVHLSVDDYGTGMSTLDYLQRIPATEIKIDRTFVMGMRTNQATRVMVNSTIQLAHSLGQKVVAEGVEDQETLDELRRMDCDLAQGFHLGRPMSFGDLSKKILAETKEAARPY